MQDSNSKTRKGDREVVSISLPLPVYYALIDTCENHNFNRSALVSAAIAQYLRSLGIQIREE